MRFSLLNLKRVGRGLLAAGMVLGAALAVTNAAAQAQPKPQAQGQTQAAKPNILVIFGDDIGQTNISAYSMGVMGYRTPNIATASPRKA